MYSRTGDLGIVKPIGSETKASVGIDTAQRLRVVLYVLGMRVSFAGKA